MRLRGAHSVIRQQAIADTKHLVDIASLPSDADIVPEFLASVQRPAAQARIMALMERGFHRPGDAENRLGHYVGQLGAWMGQSAPT
jgi:hypothetical protein